MSLLTDHTAIVTGASRGIGQAIAVRLAAEGANVAVLGRPSSSRNTEFAGTLAETVGLIRDASDRDPLVIECDLAGCDKGELVADVRAHFNEAPDILVHSAAAPREFGGGKPHVAFADMPRAMFSDGVELNVWSYWNLAQHMIPGMRERGAGWLLAISSIQAAPRPLPGSGAAANRLGGAPVYGGTKAFIDRITTGAAQELYDDNIAVNALSPTGAVRTPQSSIVAAMPDDAWEPMEAFVEAAIALVSRPPKDLTGRIAYSVPLLSALAQPIRTIDGRDLYGGWQPIDGPARWTTDGYLRGRNAAGALE